MLRGVMTGGERGLHFSTQPAGRAVDVRVRRRYGGRPTYEYETLKGYRLFIVEDEAALSAFVEQHGEVVGTLWARATNGMLSHLDANVDRDHRRQGLGLHMYVVLFTHAVQRKNIRKVKGEIHSTLAHKLQERLKEIFNTGYAALPRRSTKPEGAWDKKFSSYRLQLRGAQVVTP